MYAITMILDNSLEGVLPQHPRALYTDLYATLDDAVNTITEIRIESGFEGHPLEWHNVAQGIATAREVDDSATWTITRVKAPRSLPDRLNAYADAVEEPDEVLAGLLREAADALTY